VTDCRGPESGGFGLQSGLGSGGFRALPHRTEIRGGGPVEQWAHFPKGTSMASIGTAMARCTMYMT